MRAPVEIADDDPGLAAAFAALRDQVTAAEATALYRRLIASQDSGPAGRPQQSSGRPPAQAIPVGLVSAAV